MKIAVASANINKLKEFKQILEPFGYELISAKDLGIEMDDVEETGSSFSENSSLKARYLYEKTGLASIADDSGLNINALPDILGIYSARFMPNTNDYKLKNQELINRLINETNRTAYFTSVITYVDANAEMHFEGIVEGDIANQIMGDQGFGYDPIFIPKSYKNSFAELGYEVKNKISHRAIALKKMEAYFSEKE